MTPVRRELRTLYALAWPVVVTRVATLMLGLVDTWMVGRLGTREMEAVGLADVCQFGSIILVIGLLQGIDPIVSQAKGAGDRRRLGLALQRGLLLAVLLTGPLSLFWHYTGDVLTAMGQSAFNASLADRYAHAQMFSIAPLLALIVLQQYLMGRGIVKTPLYVVLAANLVNVLLNEVLIFGRFGFPALGVEGAAIATGLTRVFSVLALAGVVVRARLWRGGWVGWSRDAWKPSGLLEIVRIGLPIGVAFGLEVWAFQSSTVLAGWLPTPNAAAHVIVLRTASLAFMVPLGLSVATSTRVGNLIGKRNFREAQVAAWVAFGLCGAAMSVSSLVFILGANVLPLVFTDDPTAVALAAGVFPIAAAFQLFDGTQAVGGGVLRGMGRTRPAATFSLVGYCAIALPLGYYLGFVEAWGLAGIWWGLASGLCVVSILFVVWVYRRGPATCAATPPPATAA